MGSLLAKLKPKRRWVQVSLRTVLLLVTLLCVALSLWVVPAERQRRAVNAIMALDGTVVLAVPSTALQRWLPADAFCSVREVSLWGLKVTDADLTHLRTLASVERLYLHDTQLTDRGLAHLERLTNVRELSLGGTQVTDAGLAHLQGMMSLQWLYLGETQVTDGGVARLRKTLPKCEIIGP